MYNAEVAATGFYLPDKRLGNDELLQAIDCLNNRLLDKIGVNERRIAASDEFVSDLAVKAARRLLEENDINSSDVEFLIVCTQTPDYFLPTTACLVQSRLGLGTNCGAFDINLGCSGFIYALSVASSLIHCNTVSNVLIINADTYTRFIHPRDKSTRPIFGDGASAVFVKRSDKPKIGRFVFGTDGTGANNLIVKAGAMKNRSIETGDKTDRYNNTVSDSNLYMNGPEIFRFTMNMVPQMVDDVLNSNGLYMGDIDYFIFHQASKYLLDSLKEKMEIPDNKFCINMENTGNTVSATIPIALRKAEEEGSINKGMKLLLAGFGVGYSWGATIIEI